MASTSSTHPIFGDLSAHRKDSTAIVEHDSGKHFSYGQLLRDVSVYGQQLRASVGDGKLNGQRVAFLIENGYEYVVTLLAALAANAVALPFSSGFPSSELRYILDDSTASLLIASDRLFEKAKEALQDVKHNVVLKRSSECLEPTQQNEEEHWSETAEGGLMLYTSGTTSRPKGVLLPVTALAAQAASLREAWKYSTDDYLLHVLPLHHIHGCINALLTPLLAGCKVEMMFPFNAKSVWERLALPYASKESEKQAITFLTAVPTIYTRLHASFKDLPADVQSAARASINPKNMRLAISGSAALPTPTKEAWRELSSGMNLLERYGMTEIGMALSCGLDDADRVDGSVGWPLPGVEVRLVDVDTNEVLQSPEGEGEIHVRGATVFTEYWNNPAATATEFVEAEDGTSKWFKTGDVAKRAWVQGAGQGSSNHWAKGPAYFIQGRKSADIIKSGGEKVSALEVERELLSLPEVSECAVVGLESAQWGQKVAAVVVLTEAGLTAGRAGKAWGVMDLRRALKDRLVNYKIPQELKVVASIPRNAMGKVNKKSLVKELFDESGK